MSKHNLRIRVNQHDADRAGRQLSAPHLLTADQLMAAEMVFGAWSTRERCGFGWIELVRETAAPEALPIMTDPASPRSKNTSWDAVKAEARRLNYVIPTGGLSKQRRGQIIKELRALGAAV